ncbi:MAG TPA: ribose-phosphate diphosphokinase [Chitinophagales bacterium]|nr:ribose-phosphate diphosphokinase [Chitinophagales bacterium]
MSSYPKLLFSTQSYQYLREKILQAGNFEKGETTYTKFPDGEIYQRILTHVEGREAIIIGGTISDADTLELFDLACSIETYGAISLTLIIPFFGYSTMERAVKDGEVVKAKTRAILFSSIPETSLGNKVLLMDLHSEGLPHYFEGALRAVHVYCKPIIMEAARELGGYDFVLASTDAGRAKWVESLANDLGVNAAFVFKRRVSGNETHVTTISAEVLGKNVVIYDDMIRTGGSLIDAAYAYKQAGAREIAVITTHGLFVNDALQRIQNSGIINKIICTDTHPNALALQGSFLSVKTVAGLLSEKINGEW